MRAVIASATILLLASQASAQNGKNEIGIFTEPDFYENVAQFQGFLNGIEYRHTVVRNLACRFGVGYAKIEKDYVNSGYRASNDTLIVNFSGRYLVSFIPVISAGLEAKHCIRNNWYWFTGLDLRLGYDFSKKDSLISVNVIDTGTTASGSYNRLSHSEDRFKSQAHGLFFGIAPYGGVKLQLQRMAAGIEIPIVFVYTDMKTDLTRSKQFTLGNVNLRVFISYRF